MSGGAKELLKHQDMKAFIFRSTNQSDCQTVIWDSKISLKLVHLELLVLTCQGGWRRIPAPLEGQGPPFHDDDGGGGGDDDDDSDGGSGSDDGDDGGVCSGCGVSNDIAGDGTGSGSGSGSATLSASFGQQICKTIIISRSAKQ